MTVGVTGSVAVEGAWRTQHRRGQVYVALAAVAWSTAGILQRELRIDLGTQVAGRALFALVALAAFVLVLARRGAIASVRPGWAGFGFAASTAVASASFIVALLAASFLGAASACAAAAIAELAA